MCGRTHTFRNHQGVELMSYGSNENEIDRILWLLENATKEKHECAFSLRRASRSVQGGFSVYFPTTLSLPS